MTKERIERLIDWEIEKNIRELSVAEAIPLGRLRQEFAMWEPEAATPAPANPIGVTSGGGAVTGHLVFPNANQSPPPGCTCGRAWWGVIPPPACPVHGIAAALRITYS